MDCLRGEAPCRRGHCVEEVDAAVYMDLVEVVGDGEVDDTVSACCRSDSRSALRTEHQVGISAAFHYSSR